MVYRIYYTIASTVLDVDTFTQDTGLGLGLEDVRGDASQHSICTQHVPKSHIGTNVLIHRLSRAIHKLYAFKLCSCYSYTAWYTWLVYKRPVLIYTTVAGIHT